MPKLKYLNLVVATSGATVIVIGSIIGVKGVVRGAGAGTWVAAISFIVGGIALQAAALNRFFKYQVDVDEEIERTLQRRLQAIPTPCRGCRNFHGLEYGGVRLVCAIHPQGVEGDICPDHDKFSNP